MATVVDSHKAFVNNWKKIEAALAPVSISIEKGTYAETHSWFVKILRWPIVKLLGALPKKLAAPLFVFGSRPNGDPRIVASTATTYAALENLYTFPRRKTKLLDKIWQSLENSQAIRNRLSLTERKLLEAIDEVDMRRKRVEAINLLSLGSGSARAVIEVLSILDGEPKVNTKLIDMSGNALKYAQTLAETFKVNIPKDSCHRDYADNLKNYCVDFKPDVVEMVGLIDYYSYDQAIGLITKIYDVLAPGGWLIACNIHPNLEQPFVTKGIGWGRMNYRYPDELTQIMCQAGFLPKNLKLVFEANKIHLLVIARKPF